MQKIFGLSALWILMLSATSAVAAPTVQVAGGKTTVKLSDSFTGALAGLGVVPSAIGPGQLKANKRGAFVRYRIPGGALDAADFRGDIFHLGGLRLTAGDTAVDLLNFIIDTQDAPVLTGLVSVNGDLVGRLPLFDLTLTMPPEVDANGRVTLRGVMVTLNAGAAEALNGIFGIEALAGGFDIGRAMVKTRIVGVSEEADDEDGDDDKD